MCRRCGSMCGYAPSNDLELGFWCSGPVDQQADSAAMCALPLHNQSLPQFQQPCALPSSSVCPETQHRYWARVVQCTHSELEHGVAWIALNNPKTTLVDFKALPLHVVMHHGHGSICEYVQSDDLEPRARRGGALAQPAGGASATSATQPIHHPTHSDRSPPPTARIGSKLGRNIEHWWYDRSPANWSAAIPRSPEITQDIYQWFQGSHSTRGHFGLKQTTSQV